MILNLVTASFGKGSLFTQLKEDAAFIKHFRPMYIDFDEYPPYSGRIYEIFEKNFIYSTTIGRILIKSIYIGLKCFIYAASSFS